MQTVDRDTGRLLTLPLVDAATGLAVPIERARFRPGPGGADTIRRLLEPATRATQ